MRFLPIILLSFLVSNSNGQDVKQPCGFHLFTNTSAQSTLEFEAKISRELSRKRLSSGSSHTLGIYFIPVVVHVIHNGGPENISDAQIASQIQILNEDFRKISGSNGDGNGVDTKIEFCLAKISPDGKCTNGIVRIKSSLTNHQTFQRGLLKELSFWNPEKYLNIYVVNSINSGILGYSSFPGGPADADGVVVRDDAFGNIGTVAPPSNLGRTLTHEIAHWFGLYHTFQDGCGTDTCADGDKVCDTPPVAAPNFVCPVINSCNIDFPDVNDQIQNYCDYTDDACKNMFTAGQRDRMQATLTAIRTNIWTYSNLIAVGCDTAYTAPSICSVVADFTVSKSYLCQGSSISFTSICLNNPTNYLWSFVGGSIASSTLEDPIVVYSTPGVFPVTLKVWNAGSADSITKSGYITVSTPPTGYPLGINEGFENPVFPWSGMTIENPDTSITWERTTLASYQGTASVRINNLININYGQSDALVLPPYNFTTYLSTPFLRFKWAYARSSPSYSDELIVLVSKDCGVNWQQVFYKNGSALVTGPTQTTEYIPDASTVWKSANINLSAFSTQSNVLVKIVNVTDGGNCLYIDNINMGDTDLIWTGVYDQLVENEISIFPNPFSSTLTIRSDRQLNGSMVTVYNMIGQICFKQLLNKGNQFQIQENLPKGLYIVELKNEKNELHFKMLKE